MGLLYARRTPRDEAEESVCRCPAAACALTDHTYNPWLLVVKCLIYDAPQEVLAGYSDADLKIIFRRRSTSDALGTRAPGTSCEAGMRRSHRHPRTQQLSPRLNRRRSAGPLPSPWPRSRFPIPSSPFSSNPSNTRWFRASGVAMAIDGSGRISLLRTLGRLRGRWSYLRERGAVGAPPRPRSRLVEEQAKDRRPRLLRSGTTTARGVRRAEVRDLETTIQMP